MGLGRHMVEAIVREHRYRPITGEVMTVGRQTVYYTPEGLDRDRTFDPIGRHSFIDRNFRAS